MGNFMERPMARSTQDDLEARLKLALPLSKLSQKVVKRDPAKSYVSVPKMADY